MRYLKSIFEHWKDEISVDYHRESEIREILYELEDIGSKITIYKDLTDENFGTPGKRIDFLNLGKKLYPTYRIYWDNRGISLNVDKVIEIKEEEITVIRRLSDIGFTMRFLGNEQIWIYHEDDLIGKEYYTPKDKELGKGKSKFISMEEAFTRMQNSFNKISEIEMVDGDIIMTPDTDKYTLSEITEFVDRSLTRHKHLNIQMYSDQNIIKISLRKYK